MYISRYHDREAGPFVYIVTSCDSYDSWDISYHMSLKAALRACISYRYHDWEVCRVPGYDLDMCHNYYVREYPIDTSTN